MKPTWTCVILCACATNGPTDPAQQQQDDVDQWNKLSAQYDQRRMDFLGKNVQDLAAIDNHVFWLDTTNFDPALRSWDDTHATKLAYSFSIGSGDNANYRASSAVILTADPTPDPPTYTAYDATTANRELGTTTIPKPPGAKWSAYAVDGSTVYFMDTSVDGTTALLRWTPGGQPTEVTTLESAGVQVGEFEDFDVKGSTMIFIESGRIWVFDLSANKATWLMNMTEISGAIDFESDGVMFETASGLEFWSNTKGSLTDLTAKINANRFKVNTTFASAAHYDQGFARYGNYVIYIGQSGLFAYDMTADKITPILLSPDSADLRVDYKYPVALPDGSAFVTGLTSTDGAVGADGPTYKLDLHAIL